MAQFARYAPLLKEDWRDIPGYEGLYKISTLGRVLSLRRNGIPNDTIINANTNGRYQRVGLRNGTRKYYSVHRLVALTFIPNPENLPQVDHINGDALDNRVENLRWVTAKENINNPITLKRHNDKMLLMRNNNRCKRIKQFDSAGNFVAAFPSIKEASRITGIEKANISAAAHRKKKWIRDHWATVRSAGGYHWIFD